MTRQPRTAQLLPLPHLTFLILVATASNARYGYEILSEVSDQSGGTVKPSIGSLYLALQRLERQDLIEEVAPSEPGDRRRYYQCTALGRDVASREARRLRGLLTVATERLSLEGQS